MAQTGVFAVVTSLHGVVAEFVPAAAVAVVTSSHYVVACTGAAAVAVGDGAVAVTS